MGEMRARLIRYAHVLAACVTVAACESRQDLLEKHASTVSRTCVECHNDAERAGGLSLQSENLANMQANPALWEKVIRKLRAGMMPPAGGPTIDRDELASFLEGELDRVAAERPNPGRSVPFHRLNRNEYANAVRDLLAVDIDVSEILPGDDSSFGFDNIAGVLKVSPTLLERYLNAAERVSRAAVGRPGAVTSVDWFRVPDDRSQERQLPGLPFGTRGGTRIEYVFPVDAEYEIAAELQRNLNESVPLYAEPQHLEVAIDGNRVAVFTLDGVPVQETAQVRARVNPEPGNEEGSSVARRVEPIVQTQETADARLRVSRAERIARDTADQSWRVRVPVTAGKHVVTAAFLNRTSALEEALRQPFERPYPSGVNITEQRAGAYLRSLEISGPYDVAGHGSAESRKRIFVCEPGAADPLAGESLACAEQILERLARRAYRRDVGEADLEPLLRFYREGAKQGFDAGIQLALKGLLVAPEFLFRVERDPEGVPPGTPYPLDDFALASRLSFFLWSSIPDDELLDAASAGRLSDPKVLEQQVRRMVADEKADAFIANFAGQWLFLRNLAAAVPVQSNFPDFDDTLREGLRRETELFFGSIVREDRSVHDLLTADYTYLNGRVAKHYGIEGVKGPHFRRVQLPPDNPRRGIFGHGSILTVTSYPDRTSPVIRGKWILENLLGAPPPAPPPNVPGLVETDGSGTKLTMRERLAVHRADPNCASCHAVMDPLGFSLENFDAVGRWRTMGDAGEVVDAMGAMPDGTEFVGVEGLRQALLKSDLFLVTLTEKLMIYALGRGIEPHDMPTVRKIVREAAKKDYRFSAFLMGVIDSDAFRMRMSAEGDEA
jgi:hypothetical protein